MLIVMLIKHKNRGFSEVLSSKRASSVVFWTFPTPSLLKNQVNHILYILIFWVDKSIWIELEDLIT